MDVPFSQAEATSSNDIPLVERAAIINLATTIMADDFLVCGRTATAIGPAPM
jgi:hypothetical protein